MTAREAIIKALSTAAGPVPIHSLDVNGISQTAVSARLRELSKAGIVIGIKHPSKPYKLWKLNDLVPHGQKPQREGQAGGGNGESFSVIEPMPSHLFPSSNGECGTGSRGGSTATNATAPGCQPLDPVAEPEIHAVRVPLCGMDDLGGLWNGK